MKDVTTATGTTVTGNAIEQLLFTEHSRTGVLGQAHTTIADQATTPLRGWLIWVGGDCERPQPRVRGHR